MLAKVNVPANSEVGLMMAAMVEAARGDGKEEWESDSGATFYMSHNRAGMTAYKKASSGATVKIANGNVLPVEGFGTIEVDLDQRGSTTKPIKMVAVADVPGFSPNLLSTLKTVEQWGKSLVYYKKRAVFAFPREGPLVVNFCPRKGLFSATGVRRTPSEGAALTLEAKTAEATRTETTGQWGSCETRLQVNVKRFAVQWIGGDGVGGEDHGPKSGREESIGKRGTPQLDVQELKLEQ